MTQEQEQALEWALNQNYQSVAARYSKTLAEMYVKAEAELKEAVELIDRIRNDDTGDWSFLMFFIDKWCGMREDKP